jgi:hypothetical protein
MQNMTYAKAIENAAHLIAIGQTEIYLWRDDADGFPWDKVTSVTSGSSYRLNGPSDMRVTAEDAGLSFSLSVDFEQRDANGRGVSLFDRERLRDVSMKLPPAARAQFATMLANEVLAPMAARTAEIRQALNSQLDSEDCVRGLIAFAEQSVDEPA